MKPFPKKFLVDPAGFEPAASACFELPAFFFPPALFIEAALGNLKEKGCAKAASCQLDHRPPKPYVAGNL